MRGQRPVAPLILATSATMAGVCLTVISIVKLTVLGRELLTVVDDVLAVDSVVFLASSLAAYVAIRADDPRVETLADILFLLGMTVMVASAFLLAYALGRS